MKFVTLLLVIISNFTVLLGQSQDISKYAPLVCAGPPPASFLENLEIKTRKLKSQYPQLNSEQRLKMASFLNEMLSSGKVLYGTELNARVDQVGKKILEKNPDLRTSTGNLCFLVLRSQSINALTTPYGLIFVTTGLLATVNSDDELAYVLCHELAHLHLKHSFNIIKYESTILKERKASLESIIDRIYEYSRENEFIADSVGYIFYRSCNFSNSAPYNIMANIEEMPHEHETVTMNELKVQSDSNLMAALLTFANPEDILVSLNKNKIDEYQKKFNFTHPNIQDRLVRIKRYSKLKNDPERPSSTSVFKKLALHEYLYTLIQNAEYEYAWKTCIILINKYNIESPFLLRTASYSVYRLLDTTEIQKSIKEINQEDKRMKLKTMMCLAYSHLNQLSSHLPLSTFDSDLNIRLKHKLSYCLQYFTSVKNNLYPKGLKFELYELPGQSDSSNIPDSKYLISYKNRKNQNHILYIGSLFKGADTIVSIIPNIKEVALTNKIKRLYNKEEKNKIRFKNGLTYAFDNTHTTGTIIDNRIGRGFKTVTYNDYIVSNLWLDELLKNENPSTELLFNSQYIEKFTMKYKTNYIHFSQTQLLLRYRKWVEVAPFLWSPVLWPILIRNYVVPQKTVFFTDILVNTKTNRIELIRYDLIKHRLTSDIINSQLYKFFYHTKTNK